MLGWHNILNLSLIYQVKRVARGDMYLTQHNITQKDEIKLKGKEEENQTKRKEA